MCYAVKGVVISFLVTCLCVALVTATPPDNRAFCTPSFCVRPIPGWEMQYDELDKNRLTFALTDTDTGGAVQNQQFISISTTDIATTQIPKMFNLPLTLEQALLIVLSSYRHPEPTEFNTASKREVSGVYGLDVSFKNRFRQGRIIVALYGDNQQLLVIAGQAFDSHAWKANGAFIKLVSSIRIR